MRKIIYIYTQKCLNLICLFPSSSLSDYLEKYSRFEKITHSLSHKEDHEKNLIWDLHYQYIYPIIQIHIYIDPNKEINKNEKWRSVVGLGMV